ncbi:OB-fold nucleic acid binding domain-containing protein [Methanocorpusculum vombati]|nr:OB-fold nucleic acid binding domain-containing protein [Methanocorpusculum vombati]
MDPSQIQQITDRISQKLESKGVSPDRQSITDKLASYINEFGVVAYEAERKVLSDQMRLYEIPEDDSPAAPSAAPEGGVYSLSEIQPGEWVTVEVKVVSLQTPTSPSIAQTGVLADSSGAVRFVVFAKASEIPPLELEQWYRIESAVVDSFRDVPSLKLHSGSRVTPIADDRSLMPAAPVRLSDLTPGVAASIQVKFIEEWETRSDRMLQTGLVADVSGKMKFVLWKDEGREKLTLGSVYNIFYASVDTFGGRLSLALNTGVWMEDEDTDIPVPVVMPAPKEDLPVTAIRDLSPGYASVRVKFVEEWELRSDRMMQTGLVGDETGRIKFVLWKDDRKEKLVPGQVYLIKNVKVDEYNGRLSLGLNSAEYSIADDGDDIVVQGVAPSVPLPVTSIRDLAVGFASLHVKFVEEWESRSERMLQTGLLGDETGRIKFVLWKDDTKEKLEPGRVYHVTNAKVDEYNGRLSLVLNNAVYEADEPDVDIAVGTVFDAYAGTIVQISGGSGLVKRCPVEGCNRVLSRQNFCPIHEIQNDYHYDLRIKAVLDDGHKAYNVLMGREVTEALTGMTMDQAIDLASESPLGLEEVQAQFTEKLCGRYVRCFGNDFEGRILVKSAEFIHLDPSATAELMNRAGTSPGGEEQ